MGVNIKGIHVICSPRSCTATTSSSPSPLIQAFDCLNLAETFSPGSFPTYPSTEVLTLVILDNLPHRAKLTLVLVYQSHLGVPLTVCSTLIFESGGPIGVPIGVQLYLEGSVLISVPTYLK